MKKRLTFIIALVLIVSCSTESVTVKYYLLDKQSLPAKKNADSVVKTYQQLDYNVQIMHVNVAKAYDQAKIALRSKSNEIQYFYYHTWAELPSSALSNFILREFKEAKLFNTVDINLYRKEAHYFVTTNVYQLERIHLDDKYFAHLKMTLEFKDVKTGNNIISHSIDKYLPIEESDAMNIFAQKINASLEKETKTFISKIHKVLSTSSK